MKAFIVSTIARQVDGEYVFVRLEKGYTRASEAEKYANSIAKKFDETIPVPGVGPVPCRCERGIMEVEIEGVEAPAKEVEVKTYTS